NEAYGITTNRLNNKIAAVVNVCSFFFQAEDGIRDFHVTGVQTCALPIYPPPLLPRRRARRRNLNNFIVNDYRVRRRRRRLNNNQSLNIELNNENENGSVNTDELLNTNFN